MIPSAWRQVVVIAAAVVLFGAALDPTQAEDKPKPIPVPLAPGVNKGNVDNMTGARYFWFWAGPGVVTINMAFKDMGLFGNPLRQSMHFNIYTADGKLISPLAIESIDKLERLSVPGTIPVRTKYVIEVKAQDSTIRMGGYYELSATGAVAFGTASNTTQKVQPVDTSLVHPAGPLTSSSSADASTNAPAAPANSTGISLYTPGASLYTPQPSPGDTSTNSGGASLYTPGASLYTPGTSLYNTGISLTPGVEVKETPKEIKIRLRGDILFDFDKADIRKSAETTLHQIVNLIQKYPNAIVRIDGFTDSKGSASYNLDLSQRRASSVMAWLAANGTPESIMSTKGHGAEHPVAPNTHSDGSDNPDGRQQNRRVEITIKK